MKLKTREKMLKFAKIGAVALAVIVLLSYLLSSFMFG